MLQREAAVTSSAFSLWEDVRVGAFEIRYVFILPGRNPRPEPSHDRFYRYQHKITGKRMSKPPDELWGGILADEMGLGKSLMMLSTILATLTQSCAFCKSCGAAGNSEKWRSRATLVIVPSACQYILTFSIWICEFSCNITAYMTDEGCSGPRWLDG